MERLEDEFFKKREEVSGKMLSAFFEGLKHFNNLRRPNLPQFRLPKRYPNPRKK